jgi:hypothetical protein
MTYMLITLDVYGINFIFSSNGDLKCRKIRQRKELGSLRLMRLIVDIFCEF